MIRVKWEPKPGEIHVGTIIGVVKGISLTTAVIADDEGPIVEISIGHLTNASASPIQRKKVTASGVTL